MPPGPFDLFLIADELLDVCTSALDTIPDLVTEDENGDPIADGVMLGAPTYRYVSGAAPIADCCDDGQLVVHVNNVTDRFSREAQPSAPKLNVPSLIVTLLRCVPVANDDGTAPSIEVEEASARQLLSDGWALWNHIYNRIRAAEGSDAAFLERCQRANFVAMQSIRPADTMCAGWQLSFLVQLDGYPEDFAT